MGNNRHWQFAFFLFATPMLAQPPGGALVSPGNGLAGSNPPISVAPSATEFLFAQDASGSPSPAPNSPAPSASADGGGGSDNGTNPAQNATTFILSNEYYTLRGGNRINTTYARFKFPWFEKRGSLLLEVPFTYYNFTASFPNVPQIGGLGDIRAQGSYNTWTSCDKKLTLINLFEVFLPTADNAVVSRGTIDNELTAFNLGTGKYVFGPGIGVVYAFRPNFIVAPLYFFEGSAFGNSNRPDIRRGKFRLFGMYAWENGVYVLPEFQALTNYHTGNNDIYIAPELGYSHKGTTAYMKPGIGVDPDNNDRQWGLEFGFRIMY